jgi:ATP-dependent Lon protease
MDSLFAAYLHGATAVTVDDPYIMKPHQVANFLRFCELLVRLGTVRTVKLVTRELSDETVGRLENIKRSLAGHHVDLSYTSSSTLHDRRIVTDTGWEISLGRGLDIYKKPTDWVSVGASDFALRPCHETSIIFHRLGSERPARRPA